jgi:hypothetical protein
MTANNNFLIGLTGVLIALASFVFNFLFTVYTYHKTQKPNFSLSRRPQPRDKPIQSEWCIAIQNVDKLIEKCMIIYDGKPFPWSGEETPIYEKTIPVGGGGVVLVPSGNQKDEAKIEVMDGKKVLRVLKYGNLISEQVTKSEISFLRSVR